MARPPEALAGDALVALVTCDLGAIARGRSVPLANLEARIGAGVGWVPANHALLPLGGIADPNPFGALGDLRLVPDRATAAGVPAAHGETALELVLCDIVGEDGEPWACCPRHALRAALQTLRAELGARAIGAFEHEFELVLDSPPAPAFSLVAQREVEPFGPAVMAALREAGVEPEMFLAEFGPHQFEIPCRPSEGVAIADRAVVLREVVRDVARRHGMRATFSPVAAPGAIGNGAHLHLSLLDEEGEPLLYDASRPAGLSALGGSFAAGVLSHAGPLVAIIAPSPVSGARLVPGHWSAGGAFLGDRHREAFVRIPAAAGRDYNLELRAADATANPYLALACVIHAGLRGVREGLPSPTALHRDLGALPAAERSALGVVDLPGSLGEALDALEADATGRSWLGPPLHAAYMAMKRAEISAVAGLDDDEICRRYARVY
jgi:glutamine synthetase